MPIATRATVRFNRDALAYTGPAAGLGVAPSATVTVGAITHGQQVNATNTGVTALGLVDGNLTTVAGATYSTGNNGQTISNRLFTDQVIVSGSNITLQGCKFRWAGAANAKAVVVTGSNVTLRNCTILPSSSSWYMAVSAAGGSGLLIEACDISGAENLLTIDAGVNSVTVQYSYMHDSSNVADPSGHRDVIEVYGGTGHNIRMNRLMHPSGETSVINVAPFFGATSVASVSVDDNMIDGGNMHFVVDLQSTGTITNTRVRRNRMGGHTDPAVLGRYAALNDVDGRGLVDTEAALTAAPNKILWPVTGADVNTWAECSDLAPDRTGQTIT